MLNFLAVLRSQAKLVETIAEDAVHNFCLKASLFDPLAQTVQKSDCLLNRKKLFLHYESIIDKH